MQYMERKGLLPAYKNRRQPKFICESSNPMDNVNYFMDNVGQMGEVERVSIFFEAMDAAIENYFLVLDEDRYGELTVLSIPYMIIADVNGEEMWLYGCSCGYPGAAGFTIEEDGLLQNLARWFQLPLDRVDLAKPMTGQRNPFWG